MSDQNLTNAPPELRRLLRRLNTESGLNVSQHIYTPDADEWFGGDLGPYTSAEEALVKGVGWLRGLYEEADRERREVIEENRRLRIALASLQAERRKGVSDE